MNELVSIVIPTNGMPWTLNRAIKSVLNQTYKNIEIIVVDDNESTSDFRSETEKIMSVYKNNTKIKYIQNEKNKERSYSRNRGAKNASGKYIMFLDNDDEFNKDKVHEQLSCMERKGEGYTFCYSSYIRKRNGKIVCRNGETREGNLLADALARNFFVHAGSNLMIKKSVFDDLGGFDEEMNTNEDIDLVVRLFAKGNKIAYSNYVGLIVNLHDLQEKRNNLIISTPKFLEKEKKEFALLSEEKQIFVIKLVGLQIIRGYPKYKVRKLIKIKKEYGVKFTDIVSYILYCLKRMITKCAFGYKL